MCMWYRSDGAYRYVSNHIRVVLVKESCPILPRPYWVNSAHAQLCVFVCVSRPKQRLDMEADKDRGGERESDEAPLCRELELVSRRAAMVWRRCSRQKAPASLRLMDGMGGSKRSFGGYETVGLGGTRGSE